jgi:hypothetical protein
LNAEFLVAEMVGRRKLSRIAILADTTSYGDGGVADIGLQPGQRGLAPVFVGRFAADAHPFSAHDHEAFSINMIWLGVWRHGEIHYFHANDAMLSAVVRRKQVP